MDYEIKARLAQVSSTMPASAEHNPCLNRQGEAERRKGEEKEERLKARRFISNRNSNKSHRSLQLCTSVPEVLHIHANV